MIASSRPLGAGACLAAIALSLSGCEGDVPQHRIGAWRAQPDYLLDFGFIPPGGTAADGVLNSCSLQALSQTLQCSGQGVCTPWKPDDTSNPISFCVCDTNWADPECRTPRKSQMATYFLNLFFGFLGLDLFYLGHFMWATLKLLTFGGFGVWWCLDIMRIGSAPVQAYRFRTAADFPHFAFVLTTVSYSMIISGILIYFSTIQFRARKRQHSMKMMNDEEGQASQVYKSVFEGRVKHGKIPERQRDERVPGPVGGPVDFRSKDTSKVGVPAAFRPADQAGPPGPPGAPPNYGSMGAAPAQNITL